MQSTEKKLISIVTPCYNEQANVLEQFNRVKKALKDFDSKYQFEHIYTDNCSTDKTWEQLSLLAANHPNVKIMRFSNNIGANRAMYMGLSRAKGDAIILIQADLQDPPEMIPEFIKGWEEGYDVVYGQILNRAEGYVISRLRTFYYYLIATFSDVRIPQNSGEFRITSRRALGAVLTHPDDDPYVRGLVARVGFKQRGIPYNRYARAAGKSSANFLFLIGYAINGVVSTSLMPLRFVSLLGVLFSFVGFALTIVFAVLKIAFPAKAPQGITMIACLLTLFSGVQLFSLGILGEYLRKVYCQTLHRPLGFIDSEKNFDSSNNSK